jgi:hypothetical protein
MFKIMVLKHLAMFMSIGILKSVFQRSENMVNKTQNLTLVKRHDGII